MRPGAPAADGRATIAATGIPDRPLEETLADTLRWLVAAGPLRAEHVGVLASDASPGG